MSVYRSTFAREWITVGDHRILVHQRDGAPGVTVRRAAMIAAWTLEASPFASSRVRVVEAFLDDSKGYRVEITLGTDDPDAFDASDAMLAAIEATFEGVDAEVRSVVVPPGPEFSDHHDHTEYVVRSVMESKHQEAYLA